MAIERFIFGQRDTLKRPSSRMALRGWSGAICLFFIAATSPSIAGDRLRQGISAAAAHNYVRAAEIFLPLAAEGDARAQSYLGFMYAHGQGVPQNYMVSAGWYRCAADQGFANAQYMLGLMYNK